MSEGAASIKDWLQAHDIDLVGIADAATLLLSYPPRPANALMPTARSVIVMGVAHSLGAVQAPGIHLWTRNKMQTSRLLDRASEKLARELERQGYLSLPVSADKPVDIFKRDPETGKKLPHTRTAGQLSLKHAAVSAGLGEIGRSNLLLTPEFGPHQRLGAVVTEAPLLPDGPRELGLCDGCLLCVKACPVSALGRDSYDVDPCFNYWSFGFDRMPPKRLGEIPGFLRMLLEHARKRDPIIEAGQTFITDVDHCIECMRACPAGERWASIRPGKRS
jgi:epoxyqueuosine reductase QueG